MKYLVEGHVVGREKFTKFTEIERLSKIMEEMASVPREELGKRYPGERCMYEIQGNV